MHRKLLGLAGLAVMFTGLVLGIAASPAGAHHAILSGTTSCPASDHVIDWSIGNSQAKEDMTIVSAVAVLGATNYAVSGYTNPVGPAGTTSATSVIPGALTGTVTITVHGHWTDGHKSVRSADVDLDTPCAVTTTTTIPVTTTTAPPSTTTTPPTTTVPPAPPSVGPGQPPTTGGGASGPQLAFTGSPVVPLLFIGFGCITLGLCLVPRRRPRMG